MKPRRFSIFNFQGSRKRAQRKFTYWLCSECSRSSTTKLLISFTLAVAVLLGACTREGKVIEFPLIGASNTMDLVLEKVELTDSATVLTVRGFQQPNYWIKIPSYTHLVSQGVQYKLLESKGLEIDKELYMPEDGDSCFTLLFEPLPKNATSFDYIESDAENDWKIYDIDLTGKRDANKPEGLPEELLHSPETEGEIPQYAYEMGDVTINVHLLGYREGSVTNMRIPIKSLLEKEKSVHIDIDPKTGKGTATFHQYGTGLVIPMIFGGGHESFFVAPGDSIDLFVNLACINRSMRYYYGGIIEIPAIKGGWTKGSRYDALNNLPVAALEYLQRVRDAISLDFRYDMTADEYTDFVIRIYKEQCNLIDEQPYHAWYKEKVKASSITPFLLVDLIEDERLLAESEESTRFDFSIGVDPILPHHFRKVMAHMDTSSPWFLLSLYNNYIVEETKRIEVLREDKLLRELAFASNAVMEAYNGQLTDSVMQLLHQMDNPFYAAMCEDIINRTREAIATSSRDLTHVEDIAPEVLLDAIIAPHKGKVVLVDFWNTWCGPCRDAIKAIEPYKTGELAGENLVWVYIANETSPINTYTETIPSIKGIHYRVNDTQWDYLTKRFNITGIPSYVLVDKEGNYTLRNDLRDHSKMVSTLKEELEK